MFATAKILIWKQFTTLLYLSYRFRSCVCNCKDTNLKAIHNGWGLWQLNARVVFATAKILIWKQFTTRSETLSARVRCVCNCKDTNLKAIHNSAPAQGSNPIVVFATAKILIWKQFTTQLEWLKIKKSCVCNCKDTNLKAIHNQLYIIKGSIYVVFATAKILIWKQFTTNKQKKEMFNSCVCNCKDTNLKAIHNTVFPIQNRIRVVFATAKILIWKQFTTKRLRKRLVTGCVCNCKDTNLKAIHNLVLVTLTLSHCCVCNCKDTNLKAIHN